MNKVLGSRVEGEHDLTETTPCHPRVIAAWREQHILQERRPESRSATKECSKLAPGVTSRARVANVPSDPRPELFRLDHSSFLKETNGKAPHQVSKRRQSKVVGLTKVRVSARAQGIKERDELGRRKIPEQLTPEIPGDTPSVSWNGGGGHAEVRKHCLHGGCNRNRGGANLGEDLTCETS